jgi:hypothetical protein
MRMGPAPRAQRKPNEGPIGMTARPSRNAGARVKGIYDVPTNEHVYFGNNRELPPWWVEFDNRFLTWGAEYEGTDSTFDVWAPYRRGVTLWGLDEDDNPYPIDQASMTAQNVPFSTPCYGAVLGEGRTGVTEMVGTGQLGGLTIRYLGYGPFPAPYIIHPPTFAIKSFRVEGDTIIESDEYAFTLLTATAPAGTVVMGYMDLPPDFVWDLQSPQIIGLSESNALLVAGASMDGEDEGLSEYRWMCVWAFDPFDPEGTLIDADYPDVARQPDVLIQLNTLGGLPNFYSIWGERRTDDEAVIVLVSYSGASVLETSQVNLLRLNGSGALIGNTVAGDFTSQYYATNTFPHYMGQDIIHSGDLRIDDGWSDLESSVPNHATGVFRYYRSDSLVYDDTRYMFIRVDEDEGFDTTETVFSVKDLASDELVARVTSDAEVDVEVAALGQQLAGGYAGPVGESLLATYRQSPQSERRQIITIEIGGLAERGTAQVITEDRRFHRLPQGLS